MNIEINVILEVPEEQYEDFLQAFEKNESVDVSITGSNSLIYGCVRKSDESEYNRGYSDRAREAEQPRF